MYSVADGKKNIKIILFTTVTFPAAVKKYEGYPESKFRSQILPLQLCSHDFAYAC
jgi:hypothetical protein